MLNGVERLVADQHASKQLTAGQLSNCTQGALESHAQLCHNGLAKPSFELQIACSCDTRLTGLNHQKRRFPADVRHAACFRLTNATSPGVYRITHAVFLTQLLLLLLLLRLLPLLLTR